MNMEIKQLKIWLNKKLSEKGHGSKKNLAEFLGILPSSLTSMLLASDSGRSIKADELIKIIKFLGEIPPFLTEETEFISLFYQANQEVKNAI
ncbi:XRE family transcriptional regulator [Bartonella sp. DGB1]|uniref:XRE family transcriptional regulator n=1 Tax=Bartonella sp. DGB1 TaxID=3239807 RepID=UPI0035244659